MNELGNKSSEFEALGSNGREFYPRTVNGFLDFVANPEGFNDGWHMHFRKAFDDNPKLLDVRKRQLLHALTHGGLSSMKATFLSIMLSCDVSGIERVSEPELIAQVIDYTPYPPRTAPREYPQDFHFLRDEGINIDQMNLALFIRDILGGNLENFRSVPDKDLLAMPLVGRTTLKKIREKYPYKPPQVK